MSFRAVAGLIIAAALFSTSAYAGVSCGTEGLSLSDADAARLENLEESRRVGLANALRAESQSERELVADLFTADSATMQAEQMAGTYQCRTIKLGGLLPLIVYRWFTCEIAVAGDGLVLQKTSGSQNFKGSLTPSGNAFTYRGALHYGYEDRPGAYGVDPERDQVGCLSVVGQPGHLMLELPQPRFESDHDVIEFRRLPD